MHFGAQQHEHQCNHKQMGKDKLSAQNTQWLKDKT